MAIEQLDTDRLRGLITAVAGADWSRSLRAIQTSGASLLQNGIWLAFGVATAEIFGYLLHRLLHSEAIPYLSRNHLLHHLKHYGPLAPMRKTEYVDATDERFALGNVGLEWILPSGFLILLFLAIFSFFRADWSHRAVFVATALGWSSFMFSYLHDRMHITGFWMERQRWFRRWFLRARRLHDIHHYSLDDNGRMNRNFGIGFSFFDGVFGTRCDRLVGFNKKGLEATRRRYDFLQDVGDQR